MKGFDRFLLALILLNGVFILDFVGEAGIEQLRSKLPSSIQKEKFQLKTDNLPDIWPSMEQLITENINKTLINSSLIDSINVTQYYYSSGSFNGTPIRVFAEIKTIPNNSTKPAIIFIHGFGGNHKQTDPFTDYYVKKGFVTISIDLPGFEGKTQGYPLIDSTLLVMGIKQPKTSFLYIQELAVLRSITLATEMNFINKDQIILVGASLGGILTLYASALDSRLAGSGVFIAAGDIKENIEYGGLLNAFIPRDVYPSPFESLEVRNFIQIFDPLIYSSHTTIPVYYSIGTNDEFFSLLAANETFTSFKGKKSLYYMFAQHHDLSIDLISNSTDMWLNDVLNNKTQLPSIETSFQKRSSLFSDQLEVIFSIDSAIQVKSVYINYREEYMGTSWKTKKITNLIENGNFIFGTYVFESSLTGAPIEWYISYELENNAKFSSPLYISSLGNVLYLPFMTLLGIFIILPLLVQFYVKYNKLSKLGYTEETKYHIVLIVAEYVTIIIIQALFIYATLSLPWFIIKYQEAFKLTSTLPNFLNFVVLNDLIGYSVTFLIYIGIIVSLFSPRIGWIFGAAISWSMALLTIFSLSPSFGYTYGFFLSLLLPILQFTVAIAFNRFLAKVVWGTEEDKATL